MPPVAASVEAYLAAVPEPYRTALEALRAQVRALVPDATEQISYGMPAFKDRGRMLVAYAAFAKHCSLFPASGSVRERLGPEIAPFFAAKGTLRFTPDHPLPADLVRRIVELRLEENDALEAAKGAKRRG